MTQGTLVDATLIAAPSSTKNIIHARDPEMHQTKKGNQWHFSMKAHIGVDRDSGLVHTVVSTAANVSDISQTPELLRGQETELWADAGYVGVDQARGHASRTHQKRTDADPQATCGQASQHDHEDDRGLAKDDGAVNLYDFR